MSRTAFLLFEPMPTPRGPPMPATAPDILLIEDDPMTRLIMRSLLQDSGYTVREAEDGKIALQSMKSHKPDLAVLDFYLPDMNGAEVMAALALLKISMPIIVVTGYDDPDLAERVLKAGASRFVHKDSQCAYLRDLPSIVADTLGTAT